MIKKEERKRKSLSKRERERERQRERERERKHLLTKVEREKFRTLQTKILLTTTT